MKKCPECGIRSAIDDNYCRSCGVELQQLEDRICECGGYLYERDRYCGHCGSRVEAPITE